MTIPHVNTLIPTIFTRTELQVPGLCVSYRTYSVSCRELERKASKLALDFFKDIRGKKKTLQVKLGFPYEELETYLIQDQSAKATQRQLGFKEVSCLEFAVSTPQKQRPVVAFRRTRLQLSVDLAMNFDEIEVPIVPIKLNKSQIKAVEVPLLQVPSLTSKPAQRTLPTFDLRTVLQIDLNSKLEVYAHTLEAYELSSLSSRQKKLQVKHTALAYKVSESICHSLNLRRPMIAVAEPLPVPDVQALYCRQRQRIELYDTFPQLEDAVYESKPHIIERRRPITLPASVQSDALIKVDVKIKLKRKGTCADPPAKAKIIDSPKLADHNLCFKAFVATDYPDQTSLQMFTPTEPRVTVLSSNNDVLAFFSEKPKKQVRFKSQVDFFPFGSPEQAVTLQISRSSKLACIYDLLMQWEGLRPRLTDDTFPNLDLLIEKSAGVKLINSSDLRSEAQLLARSKEIDRLPLSITKLLLLLDADACELSQVKRLVALKEMLRHDNLLITIELSPSIEASSEAVAIFALSMKPQSG